MHDFQRTAHAMNKSCKYTIQPLKGKCNYNNILRFWRAGVTTIQYTLELKRAAVAYACRWSYSSLELIALPVNNVAPSSDADPSMIIKAAERAAGICSLGSVSGKEFNISVSMLCCASILQFLMS